MEITNGEYDTISAYRKNIYFAVTDPETGKVTRCKRIGRMFDMSGVEYISSAGIRVLLGAYKKMNTNHGIMRIEKANDMVREVFEMTGLLELLE